MSWETWLTLILLILLIIFTVLLVGKYNVKPRYSSGKLVARIAIFAAISSILYIVPIFNFNLPFLPSFLSIHFDEIPLFICGFAYGPWAGIAATIVKTLLKLPFTSTLGVGELSDLIFTAAFLLPTTLIYRKMRNLKGVGIGFAVGLVCQLIVSVLMNIYVMLPFYMFVMGLPYEAILSMCQLVNPMVTDLSWPYALFCVLPLNLIKDAAVILVTFIVYRKIHIVLRFETKKAEQ